jgi:hypothetical protein
MKHITSNEKRTLTKNILLSLFLLFAILACKTEVQAQTVYNHVFNPMSGMVHESEKPLRDELYRQPVGDALCGVIWFWMDGEISKEGISADLKAMGEKNIKKAIIFAIRKSEEPSPTSVPFMSEKWINLFTHAVQEAARYGVEIGIHSGPGWSNTGGPWITPEHNMQVIRTTETFVSGNGHEQKIVLPQPQANLGYYRDTKVIAYPSVKTMHTAGAHLSGSQNFSSDDENRLMDGKSDVFVPIVPVAKGKSRYLEVSFTEPQKVYGVRLTHATPEYSRDVEYGNITCSGGKFQVEDNLGNFRDIGCFELGGYGEFNIGLVGEACIPSTATKFRLVFDKEDGNVFQIGELELLFQPVLSNWMKKAGYYTSHNGDIYEWNSDQNEVKTSLQLEKVVDLTDKMSADGVLLWSVPDGTWTVVRMGHTASGIAPRPLPLGIGTSLETDKLDAEATRIHYSNYPGRLAEACGDLAGKSYNCLEIDSWEVGAQNWTAKLPEEFLKRRGYDLTPYLPILLSGRIIESGETSERFLEDYRYTLIELVNENFFNTYAMLCHKNGLQTWAETYHSMFADALDVTPALDAVMTEFWGNHVPDLTKFCHIAYQAQSAAQVYGKRIVPAEAFTSHLERWTLSPKDMKNLGDLMYTFGVNRIILHRYAHQPWLDREPGMTMGPNGIHFERTNTWWNQSASWLNYLARCQSILQQGKGTGDVIFIQPEFMPQSFSYVVRMANMAKDKLVPGYGRIYMTQNGLVTQAISGSTGTIEFPLGTGYSIIVLPDYQEASSAFLKKVWKLVNAGAVVVASVKPTRAPGLDKAHNAEVKQLSNMLFGNLDGVNTKMLPIGKGMLTLGVSLEEILNIRGLKKDFDYVRKDGTTEQAGDQIAAIREVNFIHRIINGEDVYFIANKSKLSQNLIASFRVQSGSPEVYNPLTTEVLSPAVWKRNDDAVEMPLMLEPEQSLVVSFRKNKSAPAVKAFLCNQVDVFKERSMDGVNLIYDAEGTLKLETTKAGDFTIKFNDGKDIQRKVNVDTSLILNKPWQVQFVSGRGAPTGDIEFALLSDWSKHPNDGIRYYSGMAIYRTEFTSPKQWFDGMQKFILDLGEVDIIADVEINGKNFGTLWYAPFSVDVTAALKQGKNLIKVTVSNEWTNRILGDLRNPGNKPYTYCKTQLYKPEDDLRPSGLIGPVKITPVASIPIGRF